MYKLIYVMIRMMIDKSVMPDFGIVVMSEAEQRLLDFVAALILDLAHSHPRMTQEHIAAWVARVAVGEKR